MAATMTAIKATKTSTSDASAAHSHVYDFAIQAHKVEKSARANPAKAKPVRY
jgi:hypothetical protein